MIVHVDKILNEIESESVCGGCVGGAVTRHTHEYARVVVFLVETGVAWSLSLELESPPSSVVCNPAPALYELYRYRV